ncbi:MAG: hypothetical protein DMG54_26565 [Acidobacteria bacterium]|nr:MAG: hypothetical protein DMG54_26565 [Acidobacteriota bacterium]PYU76928.1 MAG: hypothetical protein DMG52_02460 [Acidobacteriota bacterium]
MSHLSFPRMLKVDFVQSFLLVVISWSLLLCVSQQAAAQMKFVQVNSAVPTSTATISATYNSAQTAGNMNVVAIGWDSSFITLKTLTDSKGNSYKLAVSYVDSTGITQAIYYAPNVVAAAAGANRITATLSASTDWPDLRILEYSGVNTLDKTASAKGTTTAAGSGSVTTTQANELLFGAMYTYGTTNGPGSGYTSRVVTGDSDLAEDEVVFATGLYSAKASMNGQEWVAQLATFYWSGGVGTVPLPPTGLTASTVSTSQINLSWTASTGATNYIVLRSTTSGGPYAQVASSVTSSSYSDTGLTASTTFYYVVQAAEAGGTSANSTQASATTQVPSVSVTISPIFVTVAPSATEQFSDTVTGSNNTAVTWAVNGVTGGNSTFGTVSTSGLYAAPATVPNPATATVTAVLQADPTKAASATVTISNGLAFYVSTTGNDANSGSSGSPWRTIQQAANAAQPGDTIYVYGGTYNEAVTINVSGNSSAGYITFRSYPGQTAIVDGTGVPVNGQTGLINIQNQNYLVVSGFEIRNYSTSSTANVPIGIYVTGADSYIQILNNHIHNIKTSAAGCNANALGIAVYGTNGSSSINNLTISGNELDHMTTGCSETMSLDGNVQYWTVSSNLIHDNNNIGIDAIGFEGVSPNSSTDQARDGSIVGNTVYNITSYGNPAYGNQYAADGIYVDGGTRITIERNVVHNADLNVELASEHSGKVTSYVTVRNNLIYQGNSVGISIGGYASNVGGTDHCTIVNNTLWGNDTKNTGSGEFQIQYYATNNMFKNNILYAGSQGLFVNSFTNSESNPVDSDYNLFYSSVGSSAGQWVWNGTTDTGFSLYQSTTGKDGHSQFADPQYIDLSSTPPNLDVQSTSPAVNTGMNLGSSLVGTVDYAGKLRVNVNGQINIGAYEQ